MGLHDFTGDTEVDPGANLTVTTNKIDVSSMRRNVSDLVYSDDGIGHYSDFEHLFDSIK